MTDYFKFPCIARSSHGLFQRGPQAACFRISRIQNSNLTTLYLTHRSYKPKLGESSIVPHTTRSEIVHQECEPQTLVCPVKYLRSIGFSRKFMAQLGKKHYAAL